MIEAGFEVVCAIEKNEEAAETYRVNIGDHIHVADITKFDKSQLAKYMAPIWWAGSPCQGFSLANQRSRYIDNPNNKLVREYIKSIKANPYSSIFVLENVPQILTAGKGKFLNEIKEELSEFTITHGVLNSADFGDAQSRERAILIGSKIGEIPLPTPTVENATTVREAFEGLSDDILNQTDITASNASTIEKMKHVPQGENWKAIPDQLKSKGMFKGNTQSNVYRRLKWDEVSPTIVNVRKSLITHPEEHRIAYYISIC
ncbi:TPA: DNA cytosine methyltransferase [Salmonella enterica subsp. enterica serovar Typhi str. AG3]|nr:DNA cytosine methyltransferase [Salmonella enterica subsp. enterica serovar Typhi str. AG3]